MTFQLRDRGEGYQHNVSEADRKTARGVRDGLRAKKQGKRVAHAMKVAAMGPLPNPLVELVTAAQAGNRDAIRRANALYGATWKRARLVSGAAEPPADTAAWPTTVLQRG